jgi:hypothetical protein
LHYVKKATERGPSGMDDLKFPRAKPYLSLIILVLFPSTSIRVHEHTRTTQQWNLVVQFKDFLLLIQVWLFNKISNRNQVCSPISLPNTCCDSTIVCDFIHLWIDYTKMNYMCIHGMKPIASDSGTFNVLNVSSSGGLSVYIALSTSICNHFEK